MLSFAASASATATDTAAAAIAATVTATVYADDVTFSPTRGGFDSDSEVDDASIAGPSPPPFPTVPPIASIPQDEIDFIVEAISAVFGIVTPRDWQIEAIHHALFKEDGLLLVSRRTADGKSLLPLTIAAFKRRVTVVLVPLIGLGSDQVQKSCFYDSNIESYHIDEHRGQDAIDLRDRLMNMTEAEMNVTSIILYLSPSALCRDSGIGVGGWVGLLQTLSARGFISQFCIDEAHSVEQSGRAFRPEFVTAVTNIRTFIANSPRYITTIAMSATLRRVDRATLSRLLGVDNPTIIYGDLSRRGTDFQCIISGSTYSSTKSSCDNDLKQDPDHQCVIYTNSKTNAEDSLTEMASSLLESNQKRGGPVTIANSLTGGDGIKIKACVMESVTQYTREWDSAVEIVLPRVQIIVGTEAMNCGVSSDHLKHCKYVGIPPNLYILLQTMGRVDRRLNAIPGSNTFEIHISFDSVISMYLRVMRTASTPERNTQLIAMYEVLKFLVTPDICYHSFIERYSELIDKHDKQPCQSFCSFY